MTELEKQEILDKAKDFFTNTLVANHKKNTIKLNLKAFNINPFLVKYLASFLTGSNKPEDIAKALIYPRVLGTSINTSFGTNLQKFCITTLDGFASTTSGIDIEFIDCIDGRRKFCQIKAGPNTINKDDVKTIIDHFSSVKRLARTNGLSLSYNDLIVGVFYGTENELNAHYKRINEEYPVVVGQDFWYRLTGDENFYFDLIDTIAQSALEEDCTVLLNDTISNLADEISKDKSLFNQK
ncbi:TPA: restriction endonuclease [Clostridioides difficile]|uniref:PmeII family type II restriction endonuclease n=1 Tax=Clostridioides TaxID=1870884 RepID=UPI00094063F8|nr:PmeII family type II restriction endonuclease [Clostridioides difficile]MCC0651186.1 restriction endonuclease [Clostridioides sp. ES-S-0001-03]UDN61462.1 restriction endonuclease [Clostridioides sp. ES-W-0016-02]MBY2474591.1 restriction endonuclease [Clostridioides difficile]MBZ0512403.1 restriction endonuclease [Clostridioides difficile]MDM9751934.1 PmeII family type II restriction endonuclease [Clostridioides difficile]